MSRRTLSPAARGVVLAVRAALRAGRVDLADQADEINASPEPRATVLCAVLLDLLNDRHEPAFAALSRELTRLDRVLPRGEGVEQRASEIAEMIRGEMGR